MILFLYMLSSNVHSKHTVGSKDLKNTFQFRWIDQTQTGKTQSFNHQTTAALLLHPKSKVPILKIHLWTAGQSAKYHPWCRLGRSASLHSAVLLYYVIDHQLQCSWLNCVCTPYHSSSQLLCSAFHVDTQRPDLRLWYHSSWRQSTDV